MARQFNDARDPGRQPLGRHRRDAERRTAQARLRDRRVNFLFVVDLYNEGVDIPEVDTVLFLRPTESLTVFLQQLGRGLRLHQDKDCLTVLDFVGQRTAISGSTCGTGPCYRPAGRSTSRSSTASRTCRPAARS